MEHQRVWLFEELRAGRPGVLKLPAGDAAVLNRRWGSAGRAAFEPELRTLIKTYEQHEGGKDSISWLKADNAADFAVFDRLANSLLRDLEAVLLNHPSHQQQHQQQTPAQSKGKRKRESTLADLNPSDTNDCVSGLTLFRYAPGGKSEQHEDRGLLTFIYCPGDESLKDSSGKSVVAKEGEIIVLAGKALEIASGGKFPAALHSVANIRRERFSLVFRCRGSSSAVLDPKRFAPSSRQSEQTLEQFYTQFEASHRSVNAQSSGAAAAASSKAPAAAAAAAADNEAPADIMGRKLYSLKNLNDFDDYTQYRIASVFRHYRKVGGDGNCFYRAVYMALLEQMTKDIITLDDEENSQESESAQALLFGFFDKLLSLRRMQDQMDQDAVSTLRNSIMQHVKKVMESASMKNNPGLFLQKKILANPKIDKVLVRACRCVVAEFLEDLAEAQAEQIVNFDGLSVAEFIDQVVLMPGRDAEDVIVKFASRAFSARICVLQLDLKADERLHCLVGGEDDLSALSVFYGEVHLFQFRAGHYDLLYYTAGSSSLTEEEADGKGNHEEVTKDDNRPTATVSHVGAINARLKEMPTAA